MDKSYEVTPEDCNEAITQTYIRWVQDITMCTAFEH
jgi:hypothetical protein